MSVRDNILKAAEKNFEKKYQELILTFSNGMEVRVAVKPFTEDFENLVLVDMRISDIIDMPEGMSWEDIEE